MILRAGPFSPSFQSPSPRTRHLALGGWQVPSYLILTNDLKIKPRLPQEPRQLRQGARCLLSRARRLLRHVGHPPTSPGHLSSKGKRRDGAEVTPISVCGSENLVTGDSHTGLGSPKQGASLSRRTHSRHDQGKWPARMSRIRSPVTPPVDNVIPVWVDQLVDAIPLVHLIVAVLRVPVSMDHDLSLFPRNNRHCKQCDSRRPRWIPVSQGIPVHGYGQPESPQMATTSRY